MLEKSNTFFNKKFMDEITSYFNSLSVDGLFWNKCALNFIWARIFTFTEILLHNKAYIVIQDIQYSYVDDPLNVR